ncbi:MAG: amidohydrolase [Deltaproteobacteria bacterium]|uniref:Amidohydrolase n=1 Tax=Candidatus Zymogenus saltonus TaxID=2844893 RepID=A0A9D8PKU1_9DELT|nr:amidohydrolase [Candidatus Zymogenus saltonus]
MIIDMHIHPFCKEATILPGFNGAAERLYGDMIDKDRFKNIAAMFEYIFTQRTVGDIIKDMDDAGVDKAVIVAADYTTASGVIAVTNEDVSRLAKEHPDRFIPFAGVDPSKGRAAVDELTRAVEELGCVGLKLVPPMQLFNFADPRFNPLWERALELGIIVWTHTAHQLSTPGSDARLGHPMLIEPVALRYPKLKIVMGHCGFPWHWEAWSVAVRHPNVYIDISAYPNLYDYLPWEAYLRFNAEGKVLFASDNPLKGFKETLDALDAVNISDEFKTKIKGENARALLGI